VTKGEAKKLHRARQLKKRRERDRERRRDPWRIGEVLIDLAALGAEGTARELAFVLGVTEKTLWSWDRDRRRPSKANEAALSAVRRMRQVLPNVSEAQNHGE
jgi:hypothetical protein